jgi:hypothetical protein
MDAAKDYPTQVGPTIHPEIWAPRLYAKGLNTLELILRSSRSDY